MANIGRRFGCKNGLSFNEFVKINPELQNLLNIGDQFIANIETTGYNLTLSPDEMNVMSSDKLLFINVYSGESDAIGKLLSTMENSEIITKFQASLGTKASKVLYDEWKESYGEVIEPLSPSKPIGPNNPMISKTLETVITFRANNGENARRILKEVIEFSGWEYPDTRATISLMPDLPIELFSQARANVMETDSNQLIVLRKETSFPSPWNSKPVLVNKELGEYLTKNGVKP